MRPPTIADRLASFLRLVAPDSPINEICLSVQKCLPDTPSLNVLTSLGVSLETAQSIEDFTRRCVALNSVVVAETVAPPFECRPYAAPYAAPPACSDTYVTAVDVPASKDEIHFKGIRETAAMLLSGDISSEELTSIYLNRLKKFSPKLHCLISLTEGLAADQSRAADEMLSSGSPTSLLTGIPWGAKDVFAVDGYPTTWGALEYKHRELLRQADVVTKLTAQGCVLVGKLSLGALAVGDTWFGGQTRNPWNLETGSRGSSAGSAAAVAAGLVAFSLGTESIGSIACPSSACSVTGLRVTQGRLSTRGVMPLSWSLDKVGPIARSADDCGIVLSQLCDDFSWPIRLAGESLSIGTLQNYSPNGGAAVANGYAKAIAIFESIGCRLEGITLPDYPREALAFILDAEIGSQLYDLIFDPGRHMSANAEAYWSSLARQIDGISAVDYLRANRIRRMLMEDMASMMDDHAIDAFVSPAESDDSLLFSNLTGFPSVTVPSGFDELGMPTAISIVGRPFSEDTILGVAELFQNETNHHKNRPPDFAHKES